MSEGRKEDIGLLPGNRVKMLPFYSENEDEHALFPENKLIEKLLGWKKEEKILESRISGVTIKETDGDPHVYAIGILFGKEVWIKDDDYFLPDSMKDFYYQLPHDKQIQSMTQRLNARMNARIAFVITDIEGEDEINFIHASRLKAMYIRQKIHFMQQELPDYKVSRGSIVQCDILSVGERGCLASCCGTEILIDSDKLSGKFFVDDCRRYFRSGDRITGVVTKVYLNEEGSYVKVLKVSPKAYDSFLMAKNTDRVSVGGLYSGTVRSYVGSSKPKYVVVLDIGVLAQIEAKNVYNAGYLQLGEKVVVRVLYKNDGYVSGWAIRSAEAIRY